MNYCLMPWLHMFIHSDGNIYPCCKLAGAKNMVLGNVEQNLKDVWNGEKYREMRKNFKNQDYPLECHQSCFKNTNPLHVFIGQEHKNNKDNFYLNTSPDGSYEYKMKIYNLNESNLCNHKCLYCCGDNSFLLDKNKLIKVAYKNTEKLKQDFLDTADTLDHIIFAAGESTMQENYIFILKELLKRNLTPKIEFVTNFSKHTYNHTNIFELLNNFSNVYVNASIDSFNKRQEYIRVNSKWDTVEANRRELFKYPNIKFVVHSVVTNLNAYALPIFHYDWYRKGYLEKHNLRYITLTTPEQYHLSVMPDKTKQLIYDRYKYYEMFLEDEISTEVNKARPIKKVRQILREIQRAPVYSPKIFIENSVKTNSEFFNIFPEFAIC